MTTILLIVLLAVLGFSCIDGAVNVLLLPTLTNTTLEMMGIRASLNNFTAATGIQVNVNFVNTLSTTDYSSIVREYLRTQSTAVDIFMIDVVWPGAFDGFLDLTSLDTLENLSAGHNPNIIQTDIVKGKLVALPFFADYGVFYYRKDLLNKYNFTSPPTTWESLQHMASVIVTGENDPNLAGYIAQLYLYEGLTCDLMEWLAARNAGSIVAVNLTTYVDTPAFRSSLEWVTGMIKSGLIPIYSLLYKEFDGLLKFQAGQAVFMRNWPFAYAAISGSNTFSNGASGAGVTWDMTMLPGSVSTLGGWQLAASAYTSNKTATLKTMQFLTSAEFQKARAIFAGVLPTHPSLYSDNETCTAIGHCSLFGSLNVAPRPSAQCGVHYLEVSAAVYTTIGNILTGDLSIEEGLPELQTKIEKILGTWLPPDLGPPHLVEWGSSASLAMLSMGGIEVVVSVFMGIFILLNMKSKAIKHSSPKFLLLILVGVILANLSVFVSSGPPTANSCLAQTWLLAISLGIGLGSMIAKTWRIYMIFNNPYSRKRAITDAQLFLLTFGIVAIEVILLIITTMASPPVPTIITMVTYENEICSSANGGGQIALYVFNGILILIGLLLAYETRTASENFNESIHIGICMYTLTLSTLIGLAIGYLQLPNVVVGYLVQSFLVILSGLVVMGVLVGSRVLRTESGERKEVSLNNTIMKKPVNVVGKQTSMTVVILNGLYRTYKKGSFSALVRWNFAEIIFIPEAGVISITTNEDGVSVRVSGDKLNEIDTKTVEDSLYEVKIFIKGKFFEFQFNDEQNMKICVSALENFGKNYGSGGFVKRTKVVTE